MLVTTTTASTTCAGSTETGVSLGPVPAFAPSASGPLPSASAMTTTTKSPSNAPTLPTWPTRSDFTAAFPGGPLSAPLADLARFSSTGHMARSSPTRVTGTFSQARAVSPTSGFHCFQLYPTLGCGEERLTVSHRLLWWRRAPRLSVGFPMIVEGLSGFRGLGYGG
jgi:hypothetical protein